MVHDVCSDIESAASEPASADADLFLRGPANREVDLDAVFEALGTRRRRIVLTHLRDHDGDWVPVDDLVGRILAWETEFADTNSVSHETIEIDLVHRHLPKLHDSAVIEYDPGSGLSTYRGTGRIERFLDLTVREGPLP